MLAGASRLKTRSCKLQEYFDNITRKRSRMVYGTKQKLHKRLGYSNQPKSVVVEFVSHVGIPCKNVARGIRVQTKKERSEDKFGQACSIRRDVEMSFFMCRSLF